MRSGDLTSGPVARSVVAFALPLLGASVVQQLYSTVDLLFVGNALGTVATAALGVGALLLTFLAGIFSGIAVGANVKVAHLVGARDEVGVAVGTHTSVLLGVMGGLVLAVAGEVLAEPFISWMAVPQASAADAVTYLRFASAAALPMALYNACAGVLRGLGNSRIPLVAQIAGGLLNIAANWLALYVFQLGIAGCACATFASNCLAAAIACIVLMRRDSRRVGVAAADKAAVAGTTAEDGANDNVEISELRARSEKAHAWFDVGFAKSVLLFGLPVSAQTVAIVISNVVVQHQVDLLGVESIAAFAIYLKVELPIYYPILAMGQATTTFVAQNVGAENFERCRNGTRVCQWICLGVTAVMSLVMLACGQWVFWLFDQSSDVIGIGVTMISITFPFYVLYAVLEVQGGALRGFGHSLAPALVVLGNICVLRAVLVLTFGAFGLSIEAIAASYPITWFTTAALMLLCRRKLI